MDSYFGRHWRGEQSLLVAVGLNLIGGYILLTTFFVLTGQLITSEFYFIFGSLVFLTWMCWAIVGAFRCTLKRFMDRSAPTAYRLLAAILCLFVIGVGGVAAIDTWQIVVRNFL